MVWAKAIATTRPAAGVGNYSAKCRGESRSLGGGGVRVRKSGGPRSRAGHQVSGGKEQPAESPPLICHGRVRRSPKCGVGVWRTWGWGPEGRRLKWGLRGGRGPTHPATPLGPASGRPSPPGCPPRPGASPAPAGAGAGAAASAPPPGLSRSETRVS